MASDVLLPRLGHGMEAGTIVRWLKAEGDEVARGEPLFELDTDKVTQEVEAEAAGTLLKILVHDGEVPVGTRVAVIGAPGEAVIPPAAESLDVAPSAPVSEDAAQSVAALATVPTGGVQRTVEGRTKASPLARRVARERGIDLAGLSGSGPDGRVIAEDVERAARGEAPLPAPAVVRAPAPAVASAVGPGEVETVRLSSLRRTIARRLTDAWAAPAFQISMSAEMTRALELRERLVAATPDGGVRPTVSDVITKCAASALVRHRAVNAVFTGEAIEQHGSAHVAIAVATDRGLVVPVIRSADRLTIPQIAEARAGLVAKARDGKLAPEELEGGTFTISNLGMFGVESFVAVLNPPQAAILAAAAIEERPVVRDGELEVLPMMTMTLTCDHRALDGAVAAEFLGTLRSFLEEPGLQL